MRYVLLFSTPLACVCGKKNSNFAAEINQNKEEIMKEKELREKWEKWLRGGIRLLMATGISFTVVACYAPYYAPEPDGGWSEPNPEDTTQVDSINDMRAQRETQKAKIEQMAEELHNK